MNQQFPTVGVLIVSFLVAYFLVGILLTGQVVPFIGVLFLVLVPWFSVYKIRHKRLKNREIVTKAYADLKRTLQGIVEKEGIAHQEAQIRAAVKRERQARLQRERKPRPKDDPSVSKYADRIENKVRKAGGRRQGYDGSR